MNRLEDAAADLLMRADVEMGTDRRILWHLPSELIEDYFPNLHKGEGSMELLGYPVTMEVLLGEDTIVLTETLGVGDVSRETA